MGSHIGVQAQHLLYLTPIHITPRAQALTLWNNLPNEVVSALSRNSFKGRLHKYWGDRCYYLDPNESVLRNKWTANMSHWPNSTQRLTNKVKVKVHENQAFISQYQQGNTNRVDDIRVVDFPKHLLNVSFSTSSSVHEYNTSNIIKYFVWPEGVSYNNNNNNN